MIDFHYSIVRRAGRKTVSITVSRENRITVVVPRHLTDVEIREIVERKSRWIRNRIALNTERGLPQKPREFVTGELFPFMGHDYRLQVETGGISTMVALDGNKLCVRLPWRLEGRETGEIVSERLRRWYRARAQEVIGERVAHYAKLIGVEPSRVRVKDLRSRWGSCSSRGNLNFSWNIVMAPGSVIDYVVVHELCHLVHLDHSRKYWELVRFILPDYTNGRAWLKANGRLLQW